MLETIEVSSKNGTLARRLGLDVVGWHVINKRPVDKQQERKKRRLYYYNARATATPQVEPIRPTKTAPSYRATPTIYPTPPDGGSAPAVRPTKTQSVQPTREPGLWWTEPTADTPPTSGINQLYPSSTTASDKKSTTTKLTTKTAPNTTTKKKITTTDPPPTVRKINLGEIECQEGKYCEHRLPDVELMFPGLQKNDEDVELTLLKGEGIGLPHNSWIKYDKTQ